MSVPVTGTLEPYANGNFAVVDDKFQWILGAGVDLATGTDLAPDYPVATYQGTFHRWVASAKTKPVGAAIIVDVKYSTDGGSTWTSLWASNPSNRPTIADGAAQGGGTSFDTTTYIQDTMFRIDVIQTGVATKGQGLYVKLL